MNDHAALCIIFVIVLGVTAAIYGICRLCGADSETIVGIMGGLAIFFNIAAIAVRR